MSRTSDRRLILGMTRMGFALVALIAIAACLSGLALGLLADQRDQAEDSRDVVAGQAQQLADCVNDPATTQRQCERKADEVEQTIAKAVPGPAGEAGAAGAAGPAGSDGQNGAEGPQGPRGFTGPTGPRGPRGFIGPVGPEGPPGQDGADGADGATGEAGEAGTAGATGETGPQGPAGDRGPAGQDGTNGAAGPAGPAGADGRDGTATPGTYSCEGDTYLYGFTIADDGAVTLDCRPLPAGGVGPILTAP